MTLAELIRTELDIEAKDLEKARANMQNAYMDALGRYNDALILQFTLHGYSEEYRDEVSRTEAMFRKIEAEYQFLSGKMAGLESIDWKLRGLIDGYENGGEYVKSTVPRPDPWEEDNPDDFATAD